MSGIAGDRILFQLKTRGAQNIGTLGERFGISPEAARQQLVKLQGDDLVEAYEEPGGKGRPRKLWRLSEKGHGRFPDGHAQLTVDLLEQVRDLFGEAGLDQLIARREAVSLGQYGAALDGLAGVQARVAALADLRQAEGYMAEWWAEPDGSYLLVENHCPICAAATACQGLCRSELAIFREVLGPDCTVERTDHLLAGARRCAYRITPATGGVRSN